MIDLDRLAALDREWKDIEDSYRLPPYNAPLNLAKEREATLLALEAREAYNPQFEYRDPPEFPIQRILEYIRSLRPEDSALEEMYYLTAQYELLSIQAVQTHSPSVITGHTCLIYGVPDTALIETAKSILAAPNDNTPDEGSKGSLSAGEASDQMQKMLDKMGFRDWSAQPFFPMNAKVAVERQDKLVKIREDTTFSQADLRRLLMHEIGVHVLRAENGSRQPVGLFSRGLPAYLATEEGLAVYSEERAGVIEVTTMRKYAARVIAAATALSRPFSDVFQDIVSAVGPHTAFDVVARAKRGFLDTSQPGAHTKDIVYLKGYEAVRQHLQVHPEDYEVLFAGKLGLRDIGLVRELLDGNVFSWPELLPSSLYD